MEWAGSRLPADSSLSRFILARPYIDWRWRLFGQISNIYPWWSTSVLPSIYFYFHCSISDYFLVTGNILLTAYIIRRESKTEYPLVLNFKDSACDSCVELVVGTTKQVAFAKIIYEEFHYSCGNLKHKRMMV